MLKFTSLTLVSAFLLTSCTFFSNTPAPTTPVAPSETSAQPTPVPTTPVPAPGTPATPTTSDIKPTTNPTTKPATDGKTVVEPSTTDDNTESVELDKFIDDLTKDI